MQLICLQRIPWTSSVIFVTCCIIVDWNALSVIVFDLYYVFKCTWTVFLISFHRVTHSHFKNLFYPSPLNHWSCLITQCHVKFVVYCHSFQIHIQFSLYFRIGLNFFSSDLSLEFFPSLHSNCYILISSQYFNSFCLICILSTLHFRYSNR